MQPNEHNCNSDQLWNWISFPLFTHLKKLNTSLFLLMVIGNCETCLSDHIQIRPFTSPRLLICSNDISFTPAVPTQCYFKICAVGFTQFCSTSYLWYPIPLISWEVNQDLCFQHDQCSNELSHQPKCTSVCLKPVRQLWWIQLEHKEQTMRKN